MSIQPILWGWSVPNTLPKVLQFINQYRVSHNSLDSADWRISNFNTDIWECVFGTEKMAIDFNKRLYDGSQLTDVKNRELLNSLKNYLCIQTHPAITGSTTLSAATQQMKIAIALHVIDYFILNGQQYQLANHGFNLVSADDVLMFIETLSAHKAIKASIYQPVEEIASFLSTVQVSNEELETARQSYPDLFEVDETVDGYLLPAKQLATSRVWLKLNNCYELSSAESDFKYRVKRSKLLGVVLGNRVLSQLKFDGLILDGLDFHPKEKFDRELQGVPVNNADDDERASSEYVTSYIAALKSMAVARQQGISLIPDQSLAALGNTEFLQNGRTKERSRFTTLPFEVANTLFSHAIEFYLEYGDALVDYYLELAKDGTDIRAIAVPVPKKLQELGIHTWRPTAAKKDEFFSQLRDGTSLHSMFEVLYGATAILVNTLMARRLSETLDLTPASIVEDAGWYFLAFNLRKANVGGFRERALRPLPTIGADALKTLVRLATGLKEMGYSTQSTLFQFPLNSWNSNPPYFGTVPMQSGDMAQCLNRFCDYYETPTDEDGRRYYVRIHQLRRNFAMLFFWQGSFGGIEALRYFFGHKKPSMTYHYVTEAVKGKALRRVKATVAKELIRADHAATKSLANLICQRYNLTLDDLHILPETDVVNYVEDLLATGEAEIEPEFINGPNGEEYRVIYRVTNTQNHRA